MTGIGQVSQPISEGAGISLNLASSQPAPVSAPPAPRWFAVYVCTHHEQKIARQLRQRQVTCFLPVYRCMRRWKDRRKELEMVLFPGYVFARIDPQNRREVLQLPGVVRLVSRNGQPVPLPDREIESLKDGLAAGARVEPHPYLKTGRQVQIKNGPLQGMSGVLVRRKDGFRVVLSLNLITRSLAVEVDEADVGPG